MERSSYRVVQCNSHCSIQGSFGALAPLSPQPRGSRAPQTTRLPFVHRRDRRRSDHFAGMPTRSLHGRRTGAPDHSSGRPGCAAPWSVAAIDGVRMGMRAVRRAAQLPGVP
jgi:hypothetical protein